MGAASTITTARGNSGYRAASSRTTVPPMLWPTTTGRATPACVHSAATSSANAPIV
jgi:hypothetical protein